MVTRLILIRHGETDWSKASRYCGFSDIGLNENGIKQAKLLSRNLAKENVHKVYSSSMKRALEFAGIVFGCSGIGVVPELKEMNFGILEGLNHEEAMYRYPEIYQKWLDDPSSIVIPEAESLSFFKDRVENAVSQLVSINKGKTFAIVTHAGPIKAIIRRWNINPGLASVSIVEFNDGAAKIKLFDDRSYVNG